LEKCCLLNGVRIEGWYILNNICCDGTLGKVLAIESVVIVEVNLRAEGLTRLFYQSRSNGSL
jgi:hypothetical protein